MKVDITIPSAGESVAEGDIARWFKASGDHVEVDEALLELETDKASLEVTAEAAGCLTISVEEGDTVEVGQVVGYIDTEVKGKTGNDDEEDSDEAAPVDRFDTSPSLDEDRAKHATVFNLSMPSPAARKLIAENGLSAKDIPGTGKGGRISKADVLRYLENVEKEDLVKTQNIRLPKDVSPAVVQARKQIKEQEASEMAKPPTPKTETPAPKPKQAVTKAAPGSRNVRREAMTRVRKTIAKRLTQTTQETAMLTTFNEVDMSGIMGIRTKYKESFKQKHEVNLGFMSFFTKAATIALQEFPVTNASVDGEDIVYHDYCDIGIAVSTPRGLVVPNIRNAEGMSFNEIEATIMDLAIRGRDNKLTIDELSSGTFTITNGGIFGSMLSTPLINYPQSAILGMHNIVQRPVAVDGQVVIRPIMYVALSYDHRIIDGSEAVRFLVRVKDMLEDPVRLMLHV